MQYTNAAESINADQALVTETFTETFSETMSPKLDDPSWRADNLDTMSYWHPLFSQAEPSFDAVLSHFKLAATEYSRILLKNSDDPQEYLYSHLREELTLWMSVKMDSMVDEAWAAATEYSGPL